MNENNQDIKDLKIIFTALLMLISLEHKEKQLAGKYQTLASYVTEPE